MGVPQSLGSSLVRCLIAVSPGVPSVSPVAGKHFKPSKALRSTGFNNPGNTNPIPERADVGEGKGPDESAKRRCVWCNGRYFISTLPRYSLCCLWMEMGLE